VVSNVVGLTFSLVCFSSLICLFLPLVIGRLMPVAAAGLFGSATTAGLAASPGFAGGIPAGSGGGALCVAAAFAGLAASPGFAGGIPAGSGGGALCGAAAFALDVACIGLKGAARILSTSSSTGAAFAAAAGFAAAGGAAAAFAAPTFGCGNGLAFF